MIDESQIKTRLFQLEKRPIWSKKDIREWRTLVWVLDGSREQPWDGREYNKFGNREEHGEGEIKEVVER